MRHLQPYLARTLGRCALGALGALGSLLASATLGAQPRRAPAGPVEVDRQGVLRWTTNGNEVALFGVNYAAPFAYDYQSIKALGIDPKGAIDADVSHLARLGVDAYRIHVWDKEVTDSLGNLLANEHLDLFDYLLSKLEARGIKVILTPIAWWGPGYPAPDHPSPGFANRYSKPQMLVDSAARRASVRYVGQFVQHVNPYTRQRYGDDANIIAMEIFNEPWHDLAPPVETTRYINELAAAMRAAGLRKPIFYNISEHYTPAHGAAVCAANIQGVSAQWYPTGLVRGEALPGNPLPNVDAYPLPWKDTPGCASKALMVYEFDGADVDIPVMYPAMARAFRGAGFQWATQFAYDPMAVAYSNTEYQTHFLNLIYSPAKAISFLIAGEVFRQTARGFDAGVYPASERFGKFDISYARRAAEYASDTMIAHTGPTDLAPPQPTALRHIAGVGSSKAVSYTGTGAYFLDKLADGIWRLEVYPDAVPVEDPHSRGSLKRTVTRVYHAPQTMGVTLPDLGSGFTVAGLNADNVRRSVARSVSIDDLLPGAYLLSRAGTTTSAFSSATRVDGRTLGEFFAPRSSSGGTVVRHTPPPSVAVNEAAAITFDVVRATRPDSVILFFRQVGWANFARAGVLAPRSLVDPYSYAGSLRTTQQTGALEYLITVFDSSRAVTYPGATEGRPGHWDFTGARPWTTDVVAATAPIVLFDGDRDRSRVVDPGYIPGVRWRSEVIGASLPERNAWAFSVDSFGASARHVAARTMLRDGTRTRLGSAATRRLSDARLRLRWRAPLATTTPVEIALILEDGTAWGTAVTASGQWSEIEIPLAALQRVPLVLLPRPYPTFLPYDLMVTSTAPGVATMLIEGIQWGFARPAGATAGAAAGAATRIEVEWVQLVLLP